MIRRPPRSTRTDTLFPYTTLFRSRREIPTRCLTSAIMEHFGPSPPSTVSGAFIEHHRRAALTGHPLRASRRCATDQAVRRPDEVPPHIVVRHANERLKRRGGRRWPAPHNTVQPHQTPLGRYEEH